MPVWGVSFWSRVVVAVCACVTWLELRERKKTLFQRRITHISKQLHKVFLCLAFCVHSVCVFLLCYCESVISAYLYQHTQTPLFSTSQLSTMHLNRVMNVSFWCQAYRTGCALPSPPPPHRPPPPPYRGFAAMSQIP